MKAAGKTLATSIQAAVYGHIANTNKDTVIAAETGSGKTLAYLLPIIDKMTSSIQHAREPVSAAGSLPDLTNCDTRVPAAATGGIFPTAVVLVPNKELGEQGGYPIRSFAR